MSNEWKNFNLWVPLLLLGVNIFLISFLIEELTDASEPNYGILGFLTPLIGLISFFYIKEHRKKETSFLLGILQILNVAFILFPIIVSIVFILSFL